MPALTSRMARCCGVASASSTMAMTSPSWVRRMRPYPVASGTVVVSTVTAADSPRWLSMSSARVSGSSSGVSPEVTTTTPSKSSGSADSPHSTACPVPSCWSCTATSMRRPRESASPSTTGPMRSRSLPSTATIWSGATLATVCRTWASMLRPPRVCRTLGMSERIRVPAPAARTRTAAWLSVVTRTSPCAPRRSVLRWSLAKSSLRRQDSNLNYLNQNQRCCRLHHDGLAEMSA